MIDYDQDEDLIGFRGESSKQTFTKSVKSAN